MKLQVLVATMRQKDFSLFKKMNIQCDAVFANQDFTNRFERQEIKGSKAVMRTTDTRGVGKNRNIALLDADADILLFSDDDMKYYDGYCEEVLREFHLKPDADAIVFSVEYTKNGQVFETQKNENKRLHIYNALKYGTFAIAVKRESILKYNLHFSELFGGGCVYGSGEDSLFILDLLRNGGKMYSSHVIIAQNAKDSSTWFHGYNKKYFYDKGALFHCGFPRLKHLVKWYMAFRCRKISEISFGEMLKQMNRGIKGFDELKGYDGWF